MLRYYRAFALNLGVEEVHLTGVYGPVTELDGRMEEYAAIVRDVWSADAQLPFARDVQISDDDNDAAFVARLRECGLCLYDSSSSAEELTRRQAQLQKQKQRP
eukprot:IDg4503t1